MKVLFATAEFSPLVTVGGLAEASSGLVRALRDAGIEVDVVVPDYFAAPLDGERGEVLDVPGWASPATARTGIAEGVGEVTLVRVPGIERPNPYVDADGHGCHKDQSAFETAGEILRFLMPVRVRLIGWPGADADGNQRSECCHEVDARFKGIRKQSDGLSEEVRPGLEQHCEECCTDG